MAASYWSTELARRLAAAAGPDMTVTRLSGDEFGLVLPCKVSPEADLAEIRRVLERDLLVGGLTLSVQASVGYALAPVDADDVGTLMRRADVAIYLAKAEHAGIARYDVRRSLVGIEAPLPERAWTPDVTMGRPSRIRAVTEERRWT